MISKETIKMINKISQECKKCEGCPYYLPDMPDDEDCLFIHTPCMWSDYLQRTIGYNESEEN